MPMSSFPYRRRIGVRGIIFQNGQLLGVKHLEIGEDGSRGEAAFWALPGGGLDPHESLEDGLRREITEELNVDPTIGKLLFVQQFPSDREDCDEELEFFFEITNVDDFHDVDITASSHGSIELARCSFIDPHHEVVLPNFLTQVDLATAVGRLSPQFFSYL